MTIKDPEKHDYQRRIVENKVAAMVLKRVLEDFVNSVEDRDARKLGEAYAAACASLELQSDADAAARVRICKNPDGACTCLHVGNEYEGGC